MRGKKAKSLRKVLGISKPVTEQYRGGPEPYTDEWGNVKFHWMQRKVPELNVYRNIKRWYTRGWK